MTWIEEVDGPMEWGEWNGEGGVNCNQAFDTACSIINDSVA